MLSQIDELEARLDALTTAILVPLRASKQIDHQALDRLNLLVEDLISEVGNAPMIPRRLAGKLWFSFTQVLTEADHTRAPEKISRSAWTYEDQLEKLLGPWYGQGPPTPGTPRYRPPACRPTATSRARPRSTAGVLEGPPKDPRLAALQPRDASMIIPLIKWSAQPIDGEIQLPAQQELISEHLAGDLHVFSLTAPGSLAPIC